MRECINLNGLWKFLPCHGVNPEHAAPEEWGCLRVPGEWRAEAVWPAIENPGLVDRGSGPDWETFGNGSSVSAGWLTRDVAVPAEWSGKRILLTQYRHVTELEVYGGGCFLGKFDYLRDYLDITQAMKPGSSAPLYLFIPDDFGVTGDLRLETRPSGGWISSVHVLTSVEKKRLSLKAVLRDTNGVRSVSFTAEIFKDGKPVITFTASAPDTEIEENTAVMSWLWKDPVLWDIGRPNLYTLRLRAEGPEIRDRYDLRFGFREIKTAGKNFYLNGRRINFRPVNGTAA
ncbi:MAG: hypothetical protein ACLFSE_09525, partial [Spirochaetia bacterium]